MARKDGKGPVVTLQVRTDEGLVVYRDWTRVRITRSLHELSGSFELEYDDRARNTALRPALAERLQFTELRPLMAVALRIDGELVMRGWIEEVDWDVQADQVRATMHGLDPGGDLLESSANVDGPAEYKGLTVLQIAQRVLAPFGFPVRAEVDVGAPIPEFSIDVGETVFSVLDKACKQRAVLLTSDGLGGVVLTRSGFNRAPDALYTDDATSFGMRLSARDRFSDYYVKGQSRHHRQKAAPPLDGTAYPLVSRAPEGVTTAVHSRRAVSAGPLDGTAYALGTSPAALPISVTRRAAIIQSGHAKDPAVTRYRPKVWVARTGGGGAPHQVLAEWHMRVARARAEHRRFTVPDFRAGDGNRLWRPNEVVEIKWRDADPYDMLVEGVAYMQDDKGSRTELTIVGAEAYDLEPLPDEHRRHRGTRVDELPK